MSKTPKKPKKLPKIARKLTSHDFERMWGDEGPYSQVHLSEETRILDASVSRVFLVVEAEINPFTFEYIKANRARFLDDQPVLQLLDHAENRGKFGYVVGAGEVEFEGAESRRFAREQADMTIQTLIRMHAFVMKECGIMRDKAGVELAGDDGIWDEDTLIGSPAGILNNKIRFFVVFACGKDFDFKTKTTDIFTGALEKALAKFDAGTEDLRPSRGYILATFLLPFDVAPADFIEFVIRTCNATAKKMLFEKDYLVTNTKKPTPKEIMDFLGNLPDSE